MLKHHGSERFFGSVTIGAKGQVVIPAEAHKAFRLKTGDKILVLGMGPDMLALTTLSSFKKFATHFADKLDAIRGVLKKI